MRRVLFASIVCLPVCLLGLALIPRVEAQGGFDPSLYAGLHWRMIGPFRGGRVNAVAGVPSQPNVFYFGSVGGGLWKTVNAGRTWKPIFDQPGVASVGAIAVAPSDPNVLYVGTGEADMRDSIAFGDGVYKSTDAGATWTKVGLEATRQIGKIIVDPADPNVVFVAAMGHLYGPNPDRGVFRSRDGGKSWQKVLFKDENVGAIDLAFEPRNSRVIYASLWNTRRPPWYIYAPTNGPGGGIFKSTDGGATWKPLAGGLPTEGFGRSGISISPSQPSRVYAIVDAKEGGLFRSDDAGTTFTKVSGDNRLWGRGWYFTKVTVDPKNADIVYVPNVAVYRSRDGGKTWGAPLRGSPGGDDYHQLWINPNNSDLMICASDQGAIVSVNGTADIPDWSSWLNEPTAQIYHVAPDYRFPYWVTGAQQDSGAVQVHTRSDGAMLSMRDWKPLCAGGESGYTAPDPLHPALVFGGTVSVCNAETGETKNVSPERGMTEPARHAWTQPLVFSKADPKALYFANQFVYKTTDGGEHWTQISQDLTREDPGEPSNLDAAAKADVTPQQAQNKRRGVVYTIAPSPIRAPMIWAGTDDGYVHVTSDDGKTWQNVTPPGVTPWSKVVMIDASPFDANEAYVAIERHQLEDYEPHVYRTRDAGKTWQTITKGLPAGVYVQTVKADPVKRGLLFTGSERAVHVSFDDGDSWESLKLNMPAVSVRDIAIHNDDLIAATHGRGFFVIDNMTSLRQLNDASRGDAFLFKPTDAYTLAPATDDGTPVQKDEPQAENAPGGAAVDYFLKSATGPVTLEIVDASGQSVRSFSSADRPQPADPNSLNVSLLWRPQPSSLSAEPGMHRWVWDLRGTPPPGGGRGGRGGGGGGGGGRGGAPSVQAGTYTIKLTANGKTYTQPLVIKPDPRGRP